MTALASYSTGTVSVADGGTIVTSTGAIWSGTNARPGDLLQIGEFQSVIADVDADAGELAIPPWGGGDQTDVAYTIWQVSPQRFAGATAMATVNELVAALSNRDIPVIVGANETEPDPSLGDDDQYADQPTTGKKWVKLGGVWTYIGIFKAFQFKGAWDSGEDYTVGDVVTLSGSSYVCVLDHTNHTPPNTTYWQLLASKGDTGSTGSTGAGYGGTSTTSLTIGTGSKAFTTQAGYAYTNGARVRATATAGATGWLEGVATYSGTTLTITSDKTNGSGTGTAWNFNLVGEPGAGDLSSANRLSELSAAAAATDARKNLGIPATARGYLSGLTMSTAGSSSTLSVAPGVAVDDSNTDFMALAASISKTTSAWAVGSGNGGLDTGTIANNTWYHFFEIKRPDTGVVDVLFSTSASSPTMPTNYTLKRRIGSAKTNGSAQWIKFIQLGDEFLWDTITNDANAQNPGTSGTLYSLTVPTGVQVSAILAILWFNVSGSVYLAVISPDSTGAAGSSALNSMLYSVNSSTPGSTGATIRTNTSGQVKAIASGSSGSMYLNTIGWIDRRGRDA